MAKEKQKQQVPVDPEEAAINAQAEEIKRRQEEVRRAKQIQTSKDNFNAKILKLQERTADFVMQYGKDDYRSQIMMTFLNVSIEMRDAINLTSDIGTAMSCITEALGCMDNILKENVFQIEGTLGENYGFWARRKRKKMLKKAINNNAGRMKSICDMLIGNQQMAQSVVNSLRDSSLKMQTMIQKNNKRQAKINAKNASSGAPLPPSAGEKIVDDIIKARGGSVPESGSDTSTGGASGGGTSSGSGNGGVDISDI